MLDNFKHMTELVAESFVQEFEFCYDNSNLSGKTCLLKYIYLFFKRWYFTSIVPGLNISPVAILNNECEGYIPVIKCKSKSRKSKENIEISVVENSLENPVIIQDMKTIYKFADNGIYEEEFNLYNDDFYNKIYKHLIIDGPDYINYLIRIMHRTAILKFMPSIGVNVMVQNSDKLFSLNNKELFNIIIEEAILIAAEELDIYSDDNIIDSNTITNWLNNQTSADKIFEKYFLMNLEYDDEYEAVVNKAIFKQTLFDAGIVFDKYFLTPFGLYFGLIEPIYQKPYVLFDEIDIFVDVFKNWDEFDVIENPTDIVYSPCTDFRPTNKGMQLFEIAGKKEPLYIFKSYSSEELINILYKNEIDKYIKDIIYKSEPEYNIYRLKMSFPDSKTLWFNVEVKEDFNLYAFGEFIVYSLFSPESEINNLKFYTIPQNPFTEFEYPEESGKKNTIYSTNIKSIINFKGKLYFDFSFTLFGKYMELSLEIKLMGTFKNTVETTVPSVIKWSKDLGFFYSK